MCRKNLFFTHFSFCSHILIKSSKNDLYCVQVENSIYALDKSFLYTSENKISFLGDVYMLWLIGGNNLNTYKSTTDLVQLCANSCGTFCLLRASIIRNKSPPTPKSNLKF